MTVMSIDLAREIADPAIIADLIGVPYSLWGGNCHSVSLKVLRTGIFGDGRIARGTHPQVGGQHSWIVLGEDVYDPDSIVVDPTLAHNDPSVTGIWAGRNLLGHRPFGLGSIWSAGRPPPPTGGIITLDSGVVLSAEARAFLAAIGPMDHYGWHVLAHSPVQGWPAGEILAAMDDTRGLAALVPVDALGMLTDRNPGRLYW